MATNEINCGVRWQSSVTIALILQCGMAAGIWYGLKIHPWLAWLAACSLVTFFFYGMDKWSAAKGWRRTPEFALWFLILIGGVAGGWVGQIVFRHKIRKMAFWVVLVLATLIHCAVLWHFRAVW